MRPPCDCGQCRTCRKRLDAECTRVEDRMRREWLARKWPDLDGELKRMGYVLACSGGVFRQTPKAKKAMKAGSGY